MVDSLHKGTSFDVKYVEVTEDIKDDDGNFAKEKLEVWFRNPVELVKELLGNPAFVHNTVYQPTKVYQDINKASPRYDDMWTGDWGLVVGSMGK